MICKSCGEHFFKDVYTRNQQCFNCLDIILDEDSDSDADTEIGLLLNPSGKVKACITDYEDDDSHGF